VGGGVSLGAYQAGLLYQLSETTKALETMARAEGVKPPVKLQLATGASAGSVNALLALLATCLPPERDPMKSLFWEAWVPLGFNELFPARANADEDPDAALGALSSAPLAKFADKVKARMAMMPQSCDGFDKVLAVSTTRATAVSVTLRSGLIVSRAEEKFVLRIRRAPDGRPIITNYVDVDASPPEALLDLPTEEEQATVHGRALALGALANVLRASAAFPGAFPPVLLRYCHGKDPGRRPDDDEHAPTCGAAASSARFTDGGIFDNTPLRLAHFTARRGLQLVGGALRWKRIPAGSDNELADRVGFVFVDKDNAAYPAPPDVDNEDKRTAIGFLTTFLSTAVQQAMSKELYTLAEERADAMIAITSRSLPSASGHLANFFGFFDRSFREFDFYLGMYDAGRYLERTLDTTVAREMRTSEKVRGSRPAELACMEEVLDAPGDPQLSCKATSTSFRILLQVAIDRLYSGCRWPPAGASLEGSPHCHRAALGLPRPLVRGVAAAASVEWRAHEGEDALTHMMRLLSAYEFEFRDLDRTGTATHYPARRAMAVIHADLEAVVERLGSRQDVGGQFALNVLGKAALNFVDYAPPRGIFFVDVGRSLDLGISARTSPFLDMAPRLTATFQARGFSPDPHWALTPLLGLELEPPLPGRAVVELRVGARAGVQFATDKECTAANFAVNINDCHAVAVQGTTTLAIFDRVRIEVGFEWLRPIFASHVADRWNPIYGGGLQILY
jgi:predicted acylesterase/phospholipase RssA